MTDLPSEKSSCHPIQRFRDWSSVRYGLMWSYDGPVLPVGRSGEWSHPDPSCWLIRKGWVEVSAGGARVTAREGEWIFVATPKRLQSFSDDAEILSVHFHFTWPGGEAVVEQPRSVVLKASEHPRLERTAQPLARLVKRHFPHATAFLPEEPCTFSTYLHVQNLLPNWLSAYLDTQFALGVHPRRLGVLDDRVLLAITELDRRSLSEKFSELSLIHSVGIGRSQLNALFFKAMKMTPRQYHERRRLEAAQRLLSNTAMSVKEIAFDLGFGSESHFSHWFREKEKTSPSRYRQKSR